MLTVTATVRYNIIIIMIMVVREIIVVVISQTLNSSHGLWTWSDAHNLTLITIILILIL